MNIQQIRNATIIVEYGGKKILIDPMLGKKGCMQPFPFSRNQHLRNPLHELPLNDFRLVCFVSPIFPGITNFKAIFHEVKDICDLFWLENLNLRGSFKSEIMAYIKQHHPHLLSLYEEIYLHKDRTYWKQLEQEAAKMAQEAQCKYVDNELPYERSPKGHPSIVNYLYHEEIRGSENTGKRNVIQ